METSFFTTLSLHVDIFQRYHLMEIRSKTWRIVRRDSFVSWFFLREMIRGGRPGDRRRSLASRRRRRDAATAGARAAARRPDRRPESLPESLPEPLPVGRAADAPALPAAAAALPAGSDSGRRRRRPAAPAAAPPPDPTPALKKKSHKMAVKAQKNKRDHVK